MSFLTPSSPCRSLDPPRAGGVRAYRGEHLWGVAESELEGLFKLLLRSRSGGRILLWHDKKNNSDEIEKTFIWPKSYMTIVRVT